mmetsp:Transcript_18572/g.28283  ORF Transcript_18572/g.28283 Transcript_18572/m.28283 type:complete len:153 (-) Transcript_18572:437-895(-)
MNQRTISQMTQPKPRLRSGAEHQHRAWAPSVAGVPQTSKKHRYPQQINVICHSSVVASDSVFDEGGNGCFGYDEFGMEIPCFDQIGSTIQVLGRGRSGEVTPATWKGKIVAVKTFVLHFDDRRSLQSVYEHELHVLRQLKPLWGERKWTHIK